MSEKKKYCHSCGHELPPKVKFCLNCGHAVKKPLYKRVFFWVAVFAVCFLAFGAIVSEDDEQSASAPSVQTEAPKNVPIDSPIVPAREFSQPEETEKPTETEKPIETKEPIETESSSNIYYVMDVVETKNLSITYQSYDGYWTGYDFWGPEDGNRIVRAYFIFENIGNNDVYCGSSDFSCYADGLKCSRYYGDTEDELPYTTISPGRKIQGYIYFEAPVGARIEFEYELDFWTEEKLIFAMG